MKISDYESTIEEMRAHGMATPNSRPKFSVPNGTEELRAAMTYFLNLENRQLEWSLQYDEVGKWLENNEGRGLFLHGTTGQGKTLIGRYAIPVVLFRNLRLVVNCYNMSEINNNPDEALSKRFVSIDDIGTEELSVKYGNRRQVVSELLDASEKNGKILIITTNLTREGIIDKYGDRIFDRIIAVTKRVAFNGKSFRE